MHSPQSANKWWYHKKKDDVTRSSWAISVYFNTTWKKSKLKIKIEVSKRLFEITHFVLNELCVTLWTLCIYIIYFYIKWTPPINGMWSPYYAWCDEAACRIYRIMWIILIFVLFWLEWFTHPFGSERPY